LVKKAAKYGLGRPVPLPCELRLRKYGVMI
jgi:hypothetical protein